MMMMDQSPTKQTWVDTGPMSSMSSLIDAAGAFLVQREEWRRQSEVQQQSRHQPNAQTSPEKSKLSEAEGDLEVRPGIQKGLSVNCLCPERPQSSLEGRILVLARCKGSRGTSKFKLSWRSAHFSLVSGILRIFRTAEDRAKWSDLRDLGSSCENLAKWRSAMTDAYIVSSIKDLDECPVQVVDKKRDYCGVSRATCAALGSLVEEDDDDNNNPNDRPALRSFSSSSDFLENDDDDDLIDHHLPDRRRQTDIEERRRHRQPSVPTSSMIHPRPSSQVYRTFDVWLKDDVTNPAARPVLKFAGTDDIHHIATLQAHLATCTQRFRKKIPQRTFSHPLLRKCGSPNRASNMDH